MLIVSEDQFGSLLTLVSAASFGPVSFLPCGITRDLSWELLKLSTIVCLINCICRRLSPVIGCYSPCSSFAFAETGLRLPDGEETVKAAINLGFIRRYNKKFSLSETWSKSIEGERKRESWNFLPGKNAEPLNTTRVLINPVKALRWSMSFLIGY